MERQRGSFGLITFTIGISSADVQTGGRIQTPQMRAALAKGDLPEVGRLGHRLKGTVVYLGAERTREAAQRTERFGQPSAGTRSEAEAAVAALEQECHVLEAVLRQHALVAAPQ